MDKIKRYKIDSNKSHKKNGRDELIRKDGCASIERHKIPAAFSKGRCGMKSWRDEPASDSQKHLLTKKGLNFSDTITKGEASDLIGTVMPAEDEMVEILRFFKVPAVDSMNQTDARKKVNEIFADENNRKKWENKNATKRQKEIYKFFGIEIPKALRSEDAEKVIQNLMENEEKWERWEQYEDEVDERQSRLEDLHESIADYRDLYDCKKISKSLLEQIIQELEASGLTFEQLESEVDYETIYKKALELKPDLILSRTKNTRSKYKNKKRNNLVWYLILAFIIWMFWMWLTK